MACLAGPLLYLEMRAASRYAGAVTVGEAKITTIEVNRSQVCLYPYGLWYHRNDGQCISPNLNVIGLCFSCKLSKTASACFITRPAVRPDFASLHIIWFSFQIWRKTLVVRVSFRMLSSKLGGSASSSTTSWDRHGLRLLLFDGRSSFRQVGW